MTKWSENNLDRAAAKSSFFFWWLLMKKLLSFSAAVLPVVAGIFLLGACSPKPQAEAPARAVKLFTVGNQPIQDSGETFAGEVHARVESSLGFRVAGKLQSRSAQLGQSVKAGQVLAQLDPADYRLAQQAATAQVQAADTARNLAAASLDSTLTPSSAKAR